MTEFKDTKPSESSHKIDHYTFGSYFIKVIVLGCFHTTP